MFIALSTKKTIPPCGGAELNLIGTHPVTFRPSERRWIDGCPTYKHSTPTG